MRIPSDAIIPRAKLDRYLLVLRRRDDKSKFLAQAGYGLDTITDQGIFQFLTLYPHR